MAGLINLYRNLRDRLVGYPDRKALRDRRLV